MPEALAGRGASPQADLRPTSGGSLRYVWQSRFGFILIEVKEDRAYVNGHLVEPAQAEDGNIAPHRLEPR